MASKKKHRPKAGPTLTTDPVLAQLKLCADAQDRLTRAETAAKRAQESRREQVRRAFAAGASTRDIAAAIQISRAKVYRLLSSPTRSGRVTPP